MLRQTPLMRPATCQMRQVYSNGAVAQNYQIQSATYLIGTYKSAETHPELNPAPFRPGVYKELPCKMYECEAYCTKDAFSVEGPLIADIRQTLTLSGDVMAYITGSPVLETLPLIYRGLPIYDSSRQDLALAKALARFQDADADVALMLAEAGETLAMLLNPCKALRELLSELFSSAGKRKRKLGLSFADALSGSWLEYRYGFLPFISDVQTIVKQFEDRMFKSENVLLAKRGASVKRTTVSVVREMSVQGLITVRGEGLVETSDRYHTKISYNLKNTGGTVDPKKRLAYWGFEPKQLVATAWEIVPFSFVSDWVWNFGDWIKAMMPKPDIKIVGLSTSHKVERTYHLQCVSVIPNPGLGAGFKTVLGPKDNEYYLSEKYLDRVLHSQTWVTPGINAEIMNLTRMFDSLSLIWQLLPKQLRR